MWRRLFLHTTHTTTLHLDNAAHLTFQRHPTTTCTLYNLYVAPAFRQQGLGRDIVREALAHVRHTHQDVRTVVLRADEGVEDFYRALGFTACAEDPQRMTRDLRDS